MKEEGVIADTWMRKINPNLINRIFNKFSKDPNTLKKCMGVIDCAVFAVYESKQNGHRENEYLEGNIGILLEEIRYEIDGSPLERGCLSI